MPETDPPAPDPALVAWSRTLTMAEKLATAADALDDAGGVNQIARKIRPIALDRAIVALRSSRQHLDVIIDGLMLEKTAGHKRPS
jgi:hypothetical protein